MGNIKVYVDSNVLSSIPDPEIDLSRLDAFNELAELENIDFVTSRKTRDEIYKTQDEDRLSRLKMIYKFMAKIQTANIKDFIPAMLGNSCLGSMALGGMTVEDPLYYKLKKVFDKDDAAHIFHAIKAHCDYFLTWDKKTILKRAKRHAEQLNDLNLAIKLVSPEELIQIFRKDGSQ
ncbi:MAG: hypothetical protein WC855_13600 [Thermodesulfovibrionales bacterium]